LQHPERIINDLGKINGNRPDLAAVVHHKQTLREVAGTSGTEQRNDKNMIMGSKQDSSPALR
jgi:hypothetical protein